MSVAQMVPLLDARTVARWVVLSAGRLAGGWVAWSVAL